MLLNDNELFRLPGLRAGSFSGLDRLEIPHNMLILRTVQQRDDNGQIELACQAKDGPEEKSGTIHFSVDDRSKKDILYRWFLKQIGRDIETIYNSEFGFDLMKKCPKCGSEMFESLEPKVTNLADVYSEPQKQIKCLRCSKCNHIENI